MEHKVFVGAFEAKDDSKGTFAARFATLQVIDHDGDVTVPGAFGKQEVLIEAYGHNDKTLPVGMGEIGEQGNDAVANGHFFLDTANGAEHYKTLKSLGAAGQWSYTFEVQDSAPGVFDGQDVRFLKKLHVIAVSPVQRGAGINTQTLDIKAADKAVTRTEADGETKAGRVLAQRNADRILAAYNTLTEVLKDAGLLETAASDSASDGDDTDQGKGRTDRKRSAVTPRSSESSTLAARVALDLMENE
jgi:hypothetical protein